MHNVSSSPAGVFSVPRRDTFHALVVQALTDDGWTITHDPLPLPYGGQDLYVDLGAECALAAEKEGRKIAVEIKSFVTPSDVHELQVALGQFTMYQDVLGEVEPDRELYLAVPQRVYDGILSAPIGQLVVQRHQIKLIVFDENEARIVKWIP